MSILVTGGTGFIGSHTVIELLEEGYDVIIVDNLSNSSKEVIDKITKITNKIVTSYFIDLLDKNSIEQIFINHEIEAVLHFAGFKAVGESVEFPLKYYTNNLVSTFNLCEVMKKHEVQNLIFSSSATVYGYPKCLPITEESPTSALNPYGRTKLMIEEFLKDLSVSDSKWKIVLLRYFNPVGAHKSGIIGENPNGVPNNLMPYITQVAARELDHVNIFGGDYSTADGTGVRDYIHVVDLAIGHLRALNNINSINGIEAFNLGTGKGYSVLEVLNMFMKVSGVSVPYSIVDRRQGDAEISFADPSKANDKLNWKADKDLYDMCKDSWNWKIKNMLEISRG